MPGNPRAIIVKAELKFPIRIAIKVPDAGIGARYLPMTEWLDENCGIGGWSIAPAGTRYASGVGRLIWIVGVEDALLFGDAR